MKPWIKKPGLDIANLFITIVGGDKYYTEEVDYP